MHIAVRVVRVLFIVVSVVYCLDETGIVDLLTCWYISTQIEFLSNGKILKLNVLQL